MRKLSLSVFPQDEIAGNTGDFYIARQERMIGRVLGMGDGKLLWQSALCKMERIVIV